MEKKYLILSDIHGNVSAFNAILDECVNELFAGIIILGDLIDYGMRSNDIIEMLVDLSEGKWKNRITVNIWGNHEKLVVDRDLDKLSTDRGRAMAEYTASRLSINSIDYIRNQMNVTGISEFDLDSLKCLAVHGSLEDYYWKSIMPDNLRGNYSGYDLIFSGHSHYSHYLLD